MFLDLLPLGADEAGKIKALKAPYQYLHPHVADACWVDLAQRENIETVIDAGSTGFLR